MAVTIALNIPRLSILVFIIAIVVGVSRIYLGVHYPTDVAAGMFVGCFTSILVHFYLLEFVYNIARSSRA